MDVVEYELFELPPRWLFLRLETSDGLVGWGEPVARGHGEAVKAAVEKLVEEYLLGADPLRIEYHWQQMYRGGFHRGGPVLMSAIAAIDQALWDLKGKHFDTPVYDLLGGAVREKVRVYHWVSSDQTVDPGAEVTRSVESGFRAIKLNATGKLERVDSPQTVADAVDELAPVLEAVPDAVDVALDFRGRASRSMAPQLLDALESVQPLFVEEPLLPEYDHVLPAVATGPSIPLATGDRLSTREAFRDVLQTGAIDIVQPNVAQAGGISDVRKIASQAATYDAAVSPGSSVGPIAFAASLQVAAAIQNFSIQEQILRFDSETTPYHRIVSNAADFALADGYVPLPETPGIGVRIDEREVRALASGDATEWSMISWKHDDGSLAEW
jgi:galactonate dehydratase